MNLKTNNMNREFLSYEQALALKELGFDEPFNPFEPFYYRNGNLCEANKDAVEYFNSYNDEVILAPLYQQTFRWFREKYKLHSYIHSDYSWNISGGIWDLNGHIGSKYDWDSDTYPTYEEAEQACLNKLIEIVKNK